MQLTRLVAFTESCDPPNDGPIFVAPQHVTLVRPSECGSVIVLVCGGFIYVEEKAELVRSALSQPQPQFMWPNMQHKEKE